MINKWHQPKLHISTSKANDIEGRYQKSTSYSDESLNILGPKRWSYHPANIQSETSLIKFEEYINTWFEPK